MIVTNRAKDPVAFRDDAGKHVLKRNASIEVVGDQHLPHILSLPGIQGGGEIPAALADELGAMVADDFAEGDEEG